MIYLTPMLFFTIQKIFAELFSSSQQFVHTQSMIPFFGTLLNRPYDIEDEEDAFQFFLDFLQELEKINSELRNGFIIHFKSHIFDLHTDQLKQESFPDQSVGFSLDVSNDDHLWPCISKFFQPAFFTGENRYVLENDEKIDAKFQYHLYGPPRVLVFQLKRIVFDFHSNSPVKKTHNFYFDEYLDLQKYFTEDPHLAHYNLKGIVTHCGSALSGHYVSYCFNPLRNQWVEYNNEQTREIDFQEVIRLSSGEIKWENQNIWENSCNSAYILFYHRRDVQGFRNEFQVNNNVLDYVKNLN